MENISELTPERMTQIKEMLKSIQVSSGNNSVIQDNKLIFTFQNKNYRVRMANQLELDGAEKAQSQLKIKLAQEVDTEGKPVNVTRRKWIQILKDTQGVDVKELEKEKEKYRDELQSVYLELAMVSSDNPDKIEEIKDKKYKIEEKFMEVTIELIEALSPCIEEQSKAQYYKYLAYACTEKQVEDKNEFEKNWVTFEDYQKDGTGLSIHSLNATQTLLLHVKE